MKKLKECECGFKTDEDLDKCPNCGKGFGRRGGKTHGYFEGAKIRDKQRAQSAKKRRRKTMVVCSQGHDVEDQDINRGNPITPRPNKDYLGIYTIECSTCKTGITVREFERTSTIKWTNAGEDDMRKAAKRKAKKDEGGSGGLILLVIIAALALMFLSGCGKKESASVPPTPIVCVVLSDTTITVFPGVDVRTEISECTDGIHTCVTVITKDKEEKSCEIVKSE